MALGRSPRIGFACAWWRPVKSTWSYTPWNLGEAMLRQPVDLVSIDARRSTAVAGLLAGAYRPTRTHWKYGWANRALAERLIRRQAVRRGCDALVEMADHTVPTAVPTFAYQDMGFSVAAEFHPLLAELDAVMYEAPRATLQRLAARQHDEYHALEGILAMSSWFRDWLVQHHDLPPDRVHVVHAGVNHQPVPLACPLPSGERRRLLFVGADWKRKAGDQVVRAVERLRSSGDRAVELTVVGPPVWPEGGDPPSWVHFVGTAPPERVAELWSQHDLFVCPSRFDAYGIVFLEARVAGLPTIGRDAYAMPELIGDAGRLVGADDGPDEIAAAIDAALDDDELVARVHAERGAAAERLSWDPVASRIVDVVSGAVGAVTA
ncbi:MAG: glycosyltransferase family 4 protein [Acidimicrobiales bacterium]